MRPLPLIKSLTLAALAIAPGLARAAEPPCLQPAEFAALAGFALPSAINGASQRCTASLPADAFLRTGAGAMATRYAGARSAAWPGAKAAFLKLGSAAEGDAAKLIGLLPDEALQQIVDAAIQAKVADTLPLERCATTDRLLLLLSPLPPENTAELIALAVSLGAGAEGAKGPATVARAGRLGKITVCPVELPRVH